MVQYLRFARTHYVKNGALTGEFDYIAVAMKPLRRLYGDTLASNFGPKSLKALQHHLIGEGLTRQGINARVGRVKRMFKWAASEELIPVSVHQALCTVCGLLAGRTNATESDPVLPVPDAAVEATLPYLQLIVADMVRFQRLTGCRPGEVCGLRPCDVDTTGDVWMYRPESYKTEHYGRDRVIVIGPKAQVVLRPYLLRAADAFCFSPDESERKRRRAAHETRKTPAKYGNCPGKCRTRNRKRPPSGQYTNDSYRRAIHRACDAAFPATEPLARRETESMRKWRERLTPKQQEELNEWQSKNRWSPNQLRHTAATEIRRQFGLEAAQVTLGHSNANVTQIYAERDLNKAAEIMRQVG
jgi:integrase